MKFNKNSLLLLLLLFSPVVAEKPQNNMPSKPSELRKWGNLSLYYLNKLAPKNIPSLAVSTVIGGITGGTCAYITKTHVNPEFGLTIPLICAWLTEVVIRNGVIGQFSQDLDRQNIAHEKTTMVIAAWLAAWIAYLKVNFNFPANLPFMQ